MMELLKIIRSENLKIYQRMSTLVMIGFLVIMACFSAISGRINSPWEPSLWGAVAGDTWLFFLITIFTMIVAAGIVANEFNWGTIKLLLIHPISRSKILLGKYLALLLFGIALTVLIFGISFVINAAWYGFKYTGADNGALPGVSTAKQAIFNSFGGVLFLYLLKYVDVMVYGTFALMLSVISKSNALTIGVSLLVMIFGPEITNYLFSDSSWAKYVVFTHLDLSKYFGPNSGQYHGVTFQFSAVILIVYLLILNLISWTVFVKRDVLT